MRRDHIFQLPVVFVIGAALAGALVAIVLNALNFAQADIVGIMCFGVGLCFIALFRSSQKISNDNHSSL